MTYTNRQPFLKLNLSLTIAKEYFPRLLRVNKITLFKNPKITSE
jgi:hypothetical protein